MDIQERIRVIMKVNKLNAAMFADKLGVQRSSISHILSGRNKPSLDLVSKILSHFPKVNASWLITGIIKSDEQRNEISIDGNKENLIEFPDNETKTIHNSVKINSSSKKVVKIITIYSDFTTEEFTPSI
jgi:transcriptional regulator with XRE-family HTH domain